MLFNVIHLGEIRCRTCFASLALHLLCKNRTEALSVLLKPWAVYECVTWFICSVGCLKRYLSRCFSQHGCLYFECPLLYLELIFHSVWVFILQRGNVDAHRHTRAHTHTHTHTHIQNPQYSTHECKIASGIQRHLHRGHTTSHSSLHFPLSHDKKLWHIFLAFSLLVYLACDVYSFSAEGGTLSVFLNSKSNTDYKTIILAINFT